MSEKIQDGRPFELGFEDLADDVWDDVIAVCERFEQDWSEEARIENYLGSSAGEPRQFRLFKLLEIDVERRRQLGETPRRQDYLERFPGEPVVIEAAFGNGSLAPDGQLSPRDSTAPVPSTGEGASRALRPAAELPQLDGYELLQQIGEGGMGVVYKARQKKPDRLVAVKMIKAGFGGSPAARQRFDNEVQAAGRLRHPNIVAVHESGEVRGQPYFSMDYVPGRSLDDVRRDAVPARRAAKYVQTVALAVQYAHDQGLLHRDLKPSNILIGEADEPYVTDFGLAKASASDEASMTATGEVIGTPSYMPPEQAQGAHERIDQRSDVYSLGAVLYALLTGRPPFSTETREQTIRQVIDDEPVRPRQLVPTLDRDIETICLHCLEKTPANRYRTAGEMAADLDRFLRGESIQAKPPGLALRSARWARRNTWKAAAGVCGLAAVLLIAVLAITRTIAAERERDLRSQAEGLAQKGQASRIRAEGLAREEQEHRERAERLLRLAEARQAALQYERMSRALDKNDFHSASVAPGGFPSSQQCLEFRLMERRQLARPEHIASLVEDYWGIVAAVSSPDAKRLVTAYSTGTVLVWDLTTGRATTKLCEGRWSDELRRRVHHFEARREDGKMMDWGPCYTGLAWLADSQRVAAVSLDGSIAMFDLEKGSIQRPYGVEESLYAVASSADGSRLVCGGSSGKLYSAAVTGGTEPKAIEGDSTVTTIIALPDSTSWLTGRADGTLELRSMEDLSPQAKWTAPGSIWGLAAKGVEDGWLVAVACEAPEIPILHVRRAEPSIQKKTELGPPETIEQPLVYHAVLFAASGDHVRGLSSLGHLTQWDLQTAKVDWSVFVLGRDARRALEGLAEQLPLPLRRVGCLILERPLDEAMGGQAENFEGRGERPAVGGIGEVGRPAPSTGGQLVVAGDDAVIHILDTSRTREANGRTIETHVGQKPRICFDAKHPGWVWALDRDGLLTVLNCRAETRLASQKVHAGLAADLTVVGNADVVATVGGDNLMRFWRWEDGQLTSARKDIRHDEALIGVAASPDGRRVAAVDATARLVVWDYATGSQVFLTRLTGDGRAANGDRRDRPLTGRLAFNHDGTRLAAFGAGQIACVFETAPFRRSPEQIWIAGMGGTAMVWSPIEPGLLIAGDDFPRLVVGQFGSASEAPKSVPFDPASMCVAMATTPDRRRFVLLEQRGVIRFLDAEHLVQLVDLQSKLTDVTDLAIDPQGQLMGVAGADGSIEIWNAASDTRDENIDIGDSADDWASSFLVEPTANVIRVESRMVQTDRRGQVGVLYVESRPGDFRSEGALHFVDEAEGYARRERLEVGDGAYTRRASSESAAFLYTPNAQPVAVFRLRTAVSSPYDGAMYVARRLGRDRWAVQTMHEHGNMGFYPLLRLDEAGLPAELVHYSFGGSYLVRSALGDGAEWHAQLIGQQGDGANLGGSWSTHGTLHSVFRRNRFNCDPGVLIYACWDGKDLRRQVIDPFQPISLPHVEFAPDGAPVVLVGKRLMRLASTGWAEYATLPPLAVDSFAINSAGDVYFVSWDAENQRVVLCERRENSWSTKAIAQFRDGTPPNFFTLRLGADGKPVVVVGCLHEPYGWLRVLRRKE